MNFITRLAIVSLVISGVANTSATAATFTDWAVSNRVTQDINRSSIYVVGGVSENPASCTSTDYYALPNTTENYDAMTAVVMTAVAGNFEIRMSIDETSCYAGRPKVLFVSFRN